MMMRGVSFFTTLVCITVLHTVTGVEYSEYQCIYSDLVLSCGSVPPGDKTISIVRAEYGQYLDVCGETCCAPGGGDCNVDVETEFPNNMADLRSTCDNQTSCTWYVDTQSLAMCPGIGEAQYIHVYYSCLPEDPTTEPPTTPMPTTEPTTTTSSTVRTTRPTTPAPGDGGLSGGVITGIVFGVIILIACIVLIVVIVYMFTRKPPAKRTVRKPRPPGSANHRVKMQYDNNAYTSDDHIQITMVDQPENGNIPVAAPAPVMSDGKRQTKPVSAAESIKYAKDKEEMIRAQYRTQKPKDANGKPSKPKKRTKKNNTGNVYENVNSRQSQGQDSVTQDTTGQDKTDNTYANIENRSS